MFPRILEKPNPAGKQKPLLRRVRKLTLNQVSESHEIDPRLVVIS
jgi:hypothetical protein